MFVSLLLLAAAQQPIVFERVVDPATGLGQARVVGTTGREGDDRLFATGIDGRVRILDHGVVDPVPFLDVSHLVVATGLAGLRAIAFHPNYDQNGFVYLWYDAPGSATGLDLVLARMTRDSADPGRVDPASHMEMRIDVDHGLPYTIPAGNPFVGLPGHAPEVAQIGFRHPWKWSCVTSPVAAVARLLCRHAAMRASAPLRSPTTTARAARSRAGTCTGALGPGALRALHRHGLLLAADLDRAAHIDRV